MTRFLADVFFEIIDNQVKKELYEKELNSSTTVYEGGGTVCSGQRPKVFHLGRAEECNSII